MHRSTKMTILATPSGNGACVLSCQPLTTKEHGYHEKLRIAKAIVSAGRQSVVLCCDYWCILLVGLKTVVIMPSPRPVVQSGDSTPVYVSPTPKVHIVQ